MMAKKEGFCFVAMQEKGSGTDSFAYNLTRTLTLTHACTDFAQTNTHAHTTHTAHLEPDGNMATNGTIGMVVVMFGVAGTGYNVVRRLAEDGKVCLIPPNFSLILQLSRLSSNKTSPPCSCQLQL